MVRELAISLKEGYQLHVRAASIHSILLQLQEKSQTQTDSSQKFSGWPAFDSTIPALLELVQDDLFGAAQERKDAEGSQVRFVKEAGGSKSMHSLELMSSLITFDPAKRSFNQRSTIDLLLGPFLERLKPDLDSKTIRRAKECLDRIVQGLSKNKTFEAEKAFGLSYATITHLFRQNKIEEKEIEDEELTDEVVSPLKVSASALSSAFEVNSNGQQRVKGSISEWRPSAKDMPRSEREAAVARKVEMKKLRKVQDGSSAPKLTGSNRSVVVVGKENIWNNPANVAAITFGLRILEIALRKGNLQSVLLEPIAPLLSDCICFSHDTEVLRLSMKCLGILLNSRSTSCTTCPEKLSSKTVDLLSTSGGNDELQHSCFKLLTHLLKTKSTDGPEAPNGGGLLEDQSRMDVLLSFLRQSILESEQHSQAISLLKVIVALKYSSSDLYDLMECLLEQSVRSPKESLRQQCSNVYVLFLLNYPMTEDRLEQEFKQVILNIGYEYSDGRLSALNLANHLLSDLPNELLEKKSQLFFLPLTIQLANDTADECRRTVATCLKTLVKRVSNDMRQSLFDYTLRWAKSPDRLLKRTSLQLYGLFLEASPHFFQRETITTDLVSSAEKVLDQLGEDDWESIYFALSFLEKLSPESKVQPLDGKHTVLSDTVLDGLIHSHVWVQLASARLLWRHLKSFDPTSFLVKQKASTFLSEHGVLFTLGKNLCAVFGQLNDTSVSNDNDGELVATIIKSLTWTVKAMENFPSLCVDTEHEEKSPTRWVLKRLSGIAKLKIPSRRRAVFKCYAALATSGLERVVKENLDCILEALHRVELESQNESGPASQFQRDSDPAPLSEEGSLAQEVLQILESKYEDSFLEAYGAVRKKAQTKKEERKRKEKVEAARDPKLAAEQKIQKQMREKKRRKRRVEEKRRDRGAVAKKRYISNSDD